MEEAQSMLFITGGSMVRLFNRFACMVLVIAYGAAAQFVPQNARIGALGGTWNIDDMNDVLRYGAYLNTYKDGVQATWNGPIFGSKAIGDALSVGVVFNRGFMLEAAAANNFYATGTNALTGITLLPEQLVTQNVPHVVAAFDLSVVTLGIDAFYEYASATYNNRTPAGGAAITSEASVRIHHPGAVASLLLGEDLIPLAFKAGFGMPSIMGKSDVGGVVTEIKSEKGLFLELGGEADLPLDELRLTLGTNCFFESYAFSTQPGTEYGNNRLSFYGGLDGDLFSTGLWGALYTVSIINRTSKITPDTTTNRSVVQRLSGGIENTWTSVWIFDECFARAGLAFSMETPIEYRRNNSTLNSRTRRTTTYQPVVPAVGAGVKKGVFQLDITLNPANWSGVVAGPAVGMVTGTVRF
jgi:hypothetical protein